MFPPKASISLTIWPFAIPPTAGLQLICAIRLISIVTNKTEDPKRAAAAAASQPAWPPPTTIISYSFNTLITNFLKNQYALIFIFSHDCLFRICTILKSQQMQKTVHNYSQKFIVNIRFK